MNRLEIALTQEFSGVTLPLEFAGVIRAGMGASISSGLLTSAALDPFTNVA
jgi:hypothetical protein